MTSEQPSGEQAQGQEQAPPESTQGGAAQQTPAQQTPPPSYEAPLQATGGPGYGRPSEPPRRRGAAWRWGCGCGLAGCLLAVAAFLVVVLLGVVGGGRGMRGLSVAGPRIALIRIEGVVVAGESGFSPFGGAATGSDDVVQQIERAVEDDAVKGILLRVNSPGGSAAAAQEIYYALQEARKHRKVVVVSMADVAASGGYYISAPAQQIWADPATITGSIGVISMHEDISGLFSKLGIRTEVLKAGKFKDMLSPFGPIAPEVRALVERLLRETHEQFIQAVAEGRKDHGLTLAEVRRLADGRIYSGAQAKKNKLIDELGGMQQALAAAGRLAGIPGKPQLTQYGPPGLLRYLFGSSGSARSQMTVSLTGGLLYDEFAARLAQGGLPRPARSGEM